MKQCYSLSTHTQHTHTFPRKHKHLTPIKNVWTRNETTKNRLCFFNVTWARERETERLYSFKGNNAFKVLSDGMHSAFNHHHIHASMCYCFILHSIDVENKKKNYSKNTCAHCTLLTLSLTQKSLEIVGVEKDRVSFENHFLSVKCFRFDFFSAALCHAGSIAQCSCALFCCYSRSLRCSIHRRNECPNSTSNSKVSSVLVSAMHILFLSRE